MKITNGDVLGLIGPNGAGKSTLLRLIASILTPTEGRISFEGIEVTEKTRIKNEISYISVETGLYEQMTPYECMFFFGMLHEIERKEIQNKIQTLAEKFKFEDFLHKKIKTLSTGTKQKVLISKGLLHDPKVLILDEPTNGLDIMAAHFVREVINNLKKQGTTIIISTHIITDIELCDQIVILNKGKLVYENKLSEIKGKYSSLEQLFLEVNNF